MAIFAKGADPEALDAAAERLRGTARELGDVTSGVDDVMGRLPSAWGGHDLEDLRGRWGPARAALLRSSATVTSLADALSRNARDQRSTSTAGGPGGPTVAPPPAWSSDHGGTDDHHGGGLLGTLASWGENASVWTYNHVAVPVVNGLADVGQAALEHPGDLLTIAGGLGLIALGSAGEGGGGLLDATGVGAVVGIPINVASAGLIASGAGLAGAGAVSLGQHAAQNDQRVLQEAHPSSSGGSGTSPGDPLPSGDRPGTAGGSWEGRVADNGKGQVWQDPAKANAPKGQPKDANEVRIMDPEADPRYPDGYVRFYNEKGQALTLDGKPGPPADTHIPRNPDGSYPVPTGWNP